MIDYKITLGEKEKDILLGIGMSSKAFRKQLLIRRALLIGLGAVLLILGIVLDSLFLDICAVFLIAVGAFLSAIQKSTLKKLAAKSDKRIYEGTREYKVDDDGIVIISYAGESKTKWEAYIDYGTYENYIWVEMVNRSVALFDRNTLSPEAVQELQGYLEKHIHRQ